VKEIKFEIPVATPMLNTFLNWHWSKRRKHTAEMALLIKEALGLRVINTHKPFKKCIVIIERHKGPSACGYPKQDWDGLIGGLKGLLDAMTVEHKHGVGLIEDDNTDCIVATPTVIRVKAPKGTEKTVVKIMEVT